MDTEMLLTQGGLLGAQIIFLLFFSPILKIILN